MKNKRMGIRLAAAVLVLGMFAFAGCGKTEIEMIISSIQNGDRRTSEKLIAKCRKKQLERLHDSQACIDRLDYLSYQLGKE